MSDFASFQKAFKGDLVTPDHPDYAKAIARWATNAQRNAKIVAFVKDASDVALAIKYAKANKLPIAIRGGGHSAVGASSSEGGLVIDLSRHLNGVRVDPEQKLAYVGGGAIWETVDKTAIEHGLATVGGTVNHTGVAGLLLGGGYGWLSGAHGLAIDNLAQATVVVADGSVLTASETENADLFWGIRGGGSNFGVCTETVLKLHPQRRTVYCGGAVYTGDVLDKILALTAEWWAKGPTEKEAMYHVLMRGHETKAPCIVVIFFYNGSEAEGRANFKAFLDLKPMADMTHEVPFEQLNALQNPYVAHGQPRYMKGIFHTKPDIPSINQALQRAAELTTDEFVVTFILEYVAPEKVHSIPNGTAAFIRSPAANGIVSVAWKNNTPENLERARAATHELVGILVKGQTGLEESKNIGYGNYDHTEDGEGVAIKGRAEGVFGANYPKLQQIKKKYDPEVIFNKWFPIEPAA